MNRSKSELKETVDRATSSIRNEPIGDDVVRDATNRVWNSLSAKTAPESHVELNSSAIAGCPDFRSQLDSYLAGTLPAARALLVEDHTRECVPCRKALRAIRSGDAPNPQPSKLTKRSAAWQRTPVVRRAIAATLVLGFGVLPVALYSHYAGSAQASEVRLESVEGNVFVLENGSLRPVSQGESVRSGRVRLGRDASAVVALADGSRVELNQRSEFSVTGSGEDVSFKLLRGDAIVRAADRSDRRLFVSSPDCLVSGQDAAFALAAGTKGSRVTSLEGDLTVDTDGQTRVIRVGEQLSTGAAVLNAGVARDANWSANPNTVALVNAIASTRREIDQRVQMPGVRYSTKLLGLLPADTAFFVAIPNLATTLRDAQRILDEKLAENEALRTWWHDRERNDAEVDGLLAQIQEFGSVLGNEIVLGGAADLNSDAKRFVVLGDVADAAGFRELARSTASKHSDSIVLVDDFATATQKAGDETVYVWIANDVFAASSSIDQLRSVASTVAEPTANTFATTPFHARIAELYREGVGFVVAADLERIVPAIVAEGTRNEDGAKERTEVLRRLGVSSLRTFIAEQKVSGGKGVTRASLVFDAAAGGIPSWLAAPGPMGALDFISPDASVVAAFVVENPLALSDELLGTLDVVEPDFGRTLQEFQRDHGIDLRQDFVAPLGGEFAFAIDGPVLPTPSWKLVFEVENPAKLQESIAHAVTELNAWSAANGRPQVSFEHSTVGSTEFHTIAIGAGLAQLTYAFADGYLVAAPSQALVESALRYRDSGYTLTQSPRFKSALPADADVNFSALFYQDLAPLVGPIVDRYKNAAPLSNEQQQALSAFSSSSKPSLAALYARDQSIVMVCTSDRGPLGITPASLIGVPGSFEMRHILESGMQTKGD